MHPVARWGLAIGGLIAYDVHCARNDVEGDSLSEVLRLTLRTDHPLGRAAFVGGWAALTSWFVPHIIRTTIKE